MESLTIENLLTYPTSSGPADIYLPRRRTIIETKVLGLADDPDKPQAGESRETPKEQLERYMRAEIAYELTCLDLDKAPNRAWTGILTDGRVWHIWRYPHEEDAVGKSVQLHFRPTTPETLIEYLRQLVKGPLIGKPWIPVDPRFIFEPHLRDLGIVFEELPESALSPTETKLKLWLEMLRTSSMEPSGHAARERLFVAHSFLVALARGVIHVLGNPKEKPTAKDILGDGFVAWIVETNKGRQWANRFLKEIHRYEWRRRPGDVLRPLYEQFVDERDRKAFWRVLHAGLACRTHCSRSL